MNIKAGIPATAAMFILFSFLALLFAPVVNDVKESYTLIIKHGTSFDGIMQLLLTSEIINSDFRPRLVAKLFSLRTKLKAGKYEIAAGTSSYKLLRILSEGKIAYEKVTIPEGLQAREIAAILQKKVETDSVEFMNLINNNEFTRSLVGVTAPGLEGFLFPNTYMFSWGMAAKQIIKIMISEFNQQVDDSIRTQISQSKFSLLQIITMASIVEGEAVIDSERDIIAAVYRNRLRKRIRLQADPTIQYIIADGPRRLLKRDLEIDSPYNTYKNYGLPPGPINNPGLASIKASINPANVEYLYFVANGDGSHTFSKSLTEHLNAKAKFDKYRRKIRRQKNSQ